MSCLPLSNYTTKVVDDISACVPGWKRFQLDADHIKLNKYYGPNDPSFESVSVQIKDMCQDATKVIERRKTSKSKSLSG